MKNQPTNNFDLVLREGNAARITETVSALFPSSDAEPKWQGQGTAYVGALSRVLVFLREKGDLDLSKSTYTDFMPLDAAKTLLQTGMKYGAEFLGVAAPLRAYCDAHQDASALETHGFATMQIARLSANCGEGVGLG